MTQKLDFDFAVARELFNKAPRDDKDFKEAVNYFNDRVFYTRKGLVYYYDDGELVFDNKADFESNNMTGFLDSSLIKAIKKNVVSYKLVLDTDEWIIDKENRKINSLKQIEAEKIPSEVEIKEKGKEYVKHFKKYVKEVLSNKDKALYDIIMKFCAMTIRRKKCTIALIVVSTTEGTGKSTLSKILEKLLGVENVIYPTAETLLRFNYGAYGKALLVFEETEGIKDKRVFDTLKNMTTSDRYHFEKKNKDAKDLENISNIYMTSNFPIHFSDRRSLNVTPSSCWLGNREAFKQLYDFSDENMKALYEYLKSIDLEGFSEQKAVHELNEDDGNLKAIEKMNNVFRFIKDEFAINKQGMKIKKLNLYEQYKMVVGNKSFQKSTFYDRIKELGIKQMKSDGTEYFTISGEDLYDQFKKRNLFCSEDFQNKKDVDFDFPKDETADLKKENEELKNRITELEKLLKSQEPQQEEEKQEKTIKKIKKQSKSEIKEGEQVLTVKAFSIKK